ncbi:MAG TPA: Holliday junction branch migration DNA helicase RuvB [Patescibacteria group bacterium]|nr:Holliday junction branch migration DNA helicase RuvB [Patescibacteria group bacterium]
MTDTIKENLLESPSPEEEKLFTSLRANTWDEFFGQDSVKEALLIAIEAAKKRDEGLEHVLLYGPPGLGKTTLAHLISGAMGKNIRVTSGPAIERAGDLAAILTNLEKGDILFIDEIHRLNKVVEEVLYPAMEDYALDIVIGKGPAARTLRLDLPQFTIIGATTKAGSLSAPLRDRFGLINRLDFYQAKDLEKIIKKASEKMHMDIDAQSVLEIAKRSRGTPRIALKLLKRARDFAQVKGEGIIANGIIHEVLAMLEIDNKGLDKSDIRFLTTIIEHHNGGPVGLETLAATLSEDSNTLEDMIEPFLMQLGFLQKTSRGRVATEAAYGHLGKKLNKSQEKLI